MRFKSNRLLVLGCFAAGLITSAAFGGRSFHTAPVTLFANSGLHPLTGYAIRTMITVTNISGSEQNVQVSMRDLNPTFVLNKAAAYSPSSPTGITGAWSFNGANASTFTVSAADVLNPPSKYAVPYAPGSGYFAIAAGRSLVFGFALACVPENGAFFCDNSEGTAFGGSHTATPNLGGSVTAVERFSIEVKEDRGALVANAYAFIFTPGVVDVVGSFDSTNVSLNGGRPF